MKIQFTPEALHDLRRVREFIAKKDPTAARLTADTLQSGIIRLKQFPQMGVAVLRAPQPQKVRALFIGEYNHTLSGWSLGDCDFVDLAR